MKLKDQESLLRSRLRYFLFKEFDSLVTFDDLTFKISYGDESMPLQTVANIASGKDQFFRLNH